MLECLGLCRFRGDKAFLGMVNYYWRSYGGEASCVVPLELGIIRGGKGKNMGYIVNWVCHKNIFSTVFVALLQFYNLLFAFIRTSAMFLTTLQGKIMN